MTREQAINYMKSSGFSNEAIADIILALTQPEKPLDFIFMIDEPNDRIDFVFSDNDKKHCRIGKLINVIKAIKKELNGLSYGGTESEV